jgi:hypothetical protein
MLAGEIRIYALSIHADYACRHSGACCTSGWPIPAERGTFEQLSARISAGRLNVPDQGPTGASLIPDPWIPDP